MKILSTNGTNDSEIQEPCIFDRDPHSYEYHTYGQIASCVRLREVLFVEKPDWKFRGCEFKTFFGLGYFLPFC
jgi:hypothetical protein